MRSVVNPLVLWIRRVGGSVVNFNSKSCLSNEPPTRLIHKTRGFTTLRILRYTILFKIFVVSYCWKLKKNVWNLYWMKKYDKFCCRNKTENKWWGKKVRISKWYYFSAVESVRLSISTHPNAFSCLFSNHCLKKDIMFRYCLQSMGLNWYSTHILKNCRNSWCKG